MTPTWDPRVALLTWCTFAHPVNLVHPCLRNILGLSFCAAASSMDSPAELRNCLDQQTHQALEEGFGGCLKDGRPVCPILSGFCRG